MRIRAVQGAAPSDDGTPRFGDLYRPEALQAANPHVFPSVGSLLWFERVNRAELLEAGAIVEIAGRKMLRGSVFVEKALEIGANQARKQARKRSGS
jgi:hypothetical protein